MGLYENALYQKEDEESVELESIILLSSADSSAISREIERGRIIAESMNWARELADQPGGALPPREFARRAAEMANEFGLGIESLTAKQIRELGMGGLWGVGKDRTRNQRLCLFRYEPDAEAKKPASNEILRVRWEGITFDTGGISIKPAKGMEEMKADMAGERPHSEPFAR